MELKKIVSGWDINASLSFKRQSFGRVLLFLKLFELSWGVLLIKQLFHGKQNDSCSAFCWDPAVLDWPFLFGKSTKSNYRSNCSRHDIAANSHRKLLSWKQRFVFVLYSGRSNSAGNAVFISWCWKRGLLEGWPGARVPEIRTASP